MKDSELSHLRKDTAMIHTVELDKQTASFVRQLENKGGLKKI
jgi:hypothetical protein